MGKGLSHWGGKKSSSLVIMCSFGMEKQDVSRFMPMPSGSSAQPPGMEERAHVVLPEEVRENIMME